MTGTPDPIDGGILRYGGQNCLWVGKGTERASNDAEALQFQSWKNQISGRERDKFQEIDST